MIMNKIFNIDRFIKLIIGNYKQYGANAITSAGIMLLIVPTIGLFESLVGGGAATNHNSRLPLQELITLIFTISTINKMYGNVNIKKGIVDFLMLPASSFEKFLAMSLICIIANPLLFFIASWALDCLLTLMGIPAYREYIGVNDIFSPDNLSTVYNMFLFCTAVLCGNMVFKKSKLSKTIFTIIASFIVVGVVFAYTSYKFVNMGVKESTGHNISEFVKDTTLLQNTVSNIFDSTTTEDVASNNNRSTVTTYNNKSTITTYKNGVKSTYQFNSTSLNSDNWRYLEEQFTTLAKILKFIYNVLIPIILLSITYYKVRKQEV